MFEDKQLATILESINFSIDTLENNLFDYKDYLSLEEKKNLLSKIQNYKNVSLKIEWILGNKGVAKILEDFETFDSSEVKRNALNT